MEYEDEYYYEDATNPFEEREPSMGVYERFMKLQTMIGSNPSAKSISQSSLPSLNYRKTSTTNRKKKITPIIRYTNSSGSQVENFVTEKIKDRIKGFVNTIGETRPWIDVSQLLVRVFEFCNQFKIQFPKSKEKQDYTILYSIIMAGRTMGIFLDTHIISINFNLKSKDLNKKIVELLPPVTSETNDILDYVFKSDKMSLIVEYKSLLPEVVGGFNSMTVMEEADYSIYENSMIKIFEDLDRNDNGDYYDRQFCVTPDKVFIYGVFELIRNKNPNVTERSICDYLAKRFNIPRVTIEKMKRLVSKNSRNK